MVICSPPPLLKAGYTHLKKVIPESIKRNSCKRREKEEKREGRGRGDRDTEKDREREERRGGGRKGQESAHEPSPRRKGEPELRV